MRKKVKVIPNSKAESMVEIGIGDEIIARVKEPAEKGKANKALIKLLSKHLGKKVKIISGARSRKKIIEIG